MYTNIPQGPTLEILRQKLEEDRALGKRTPIRIDDIMAMIRLDLVLAYSRWKDEFYKQVKGIWHGQVHQQPSF